MNTEVKMRILAAAAELLATSPEADFSTRDVCEMAGVGSPALYRQFGDKVGLLSAVVDFGFEQYLASKRVAVPSEDAVEDLKSGWDNHVAFAVTNPNYYRVMYSPGLSRRPDAEAEAFALLLAVVERAQAAGRLRLPSLLAAQMIMAANVGVAISLLYRPDTNTDPGMSDRVRNSVIDAITFGSPPIRASRLSTARTARALAAQIGVDGADPLGAAESQLLVEWLSRISSHAAAADHLEIQGAS